MASKSAPSNLSTPESGFESHVRGELEKMRLQIDSLNQSKISSMQKFEEMEREFSELKISLIKGGNLTRNERESSVGIGDTEPIYAEIEKINTRIDSLEDGINSIHGKVQSAGAVNAPVPIDTERLKKEILSEISSLPADSPKPAISERKYLMDMASFRKEISDIRGAIPSIGNSGGMEELSEKVKILDERISKMPKLSADLEAMSKKFSTDLDLLSKKLEGSDAKLSGLSEKISSIHSMPAQESSISNDIVPRISSVENAVENIKRRNDIMDDGLRKLSENFVGTVKHLSDKMRKLEEIVQDARDSMRVQMQPVMNDSQSEFPEYREAEQQTGYEDDVPAPKQNVFTKLRKAPAASQKDEEIHENDTWESRQNVSDSHDLDIIREHIQELSSIGYSKEKIMRDLLNAGYDMDLIERAYSESVPNER